MSNRKDSGVISPNPFAAWGIAVSKPVTCFTAGTKVMQF